MESQSLSSNEVKEGEELPPFCLTIPEFSGILSVRAASALRGGDGLLSPVNREARNTCVVESDARQLLFQAPSESTIQEG